jgi:hypothetical protein
MDIKKNYYDYEFTDLIKLDPNLPYSLEDIKIIILNNFVIKNKDHISSQITLKNSFLNRINELKKDSNIILTQKIRLSILLNFIRNEFTMKSTKNSYYYYDLPIDNSKSVEIFNLFIFGEMLDDIFDDEYDDYYLKKKKYELSEDSIDSYDTDDSEL